MLCKDSKQIVRVNIFALKIGTAMMSIAQKHKHSKNVLFSL